MNLPPALVVVPVTGPRGARVRAVPAEIAVALTYDRVSFAVMMASPGDLRDFAVGFSLSEGIVQSPDEIIACEIVALASGVECRMALTPARRAALEARRRRLAGPVGCGLCGIDSLEQAMRPAQNVTACVRATAAQIAGALARLPGLQRLNQQTHGVHAAAFYTPADGGLLLREDVGRHNALDKMIGAAAQAGRRGETGIVLLTSRVSIELIQKAAMFGSGILVAVSVPSGRAVSAAQAAGMTLIAVARDDGFEIFSHAERVCE